MPIEYGGMRRIAALTLGLALAAAAGWYTTMPSVRNAAARPPLTRHAQQRHDAIPPQMPRSTGRRVPARPPLPACESRRCRTGCDEPGNGRQCS